MAVVTFIPEETRRRQPTPKRKHNNHQKQKKPSSWDQIKNLLTCKQVEGFEIHDPSKPTNGYSKLGSSCRSICSFRDVVHGNTRVVHRRENSPEGSSIGKDPRLIGRKMNGRGSSMPSSGSALPRSFGGPARPNGSGGYTTSSRRMQLRKFSGCYECHAIVDPSRYSSPWATVCVCSECGEVFSKIESLEHHHSVRHAVSELGPEDSGRSIVEIIFKSSWLKKDCPIYCIERIIKVHNTRRTIQQFEDCRDAAKLHVSSHSKKNPRCAADGNELLRFHCATIACSLGARGSSSLCSSVPACGVCTIIRQGFRAARYHSGLEAVKGVRTCASSGRAHDCLAGAVHGRRAMLVCRVIAGKVKRILGENLVEDDGVSGGRGAWGGAYDSVVGYAGLYSDLEELWVFNPKAILSCFVVIY